MRRYSQTTIGIVDFDPTIGRVEHVGMRGDTTLEPYDSALAKRLFRKYLGEGQVAWRKMFVCFDTRNDRLIKFTPETVVVRDQSHPSPC